MELKEALKLALQSLWANKLRTVLTLLGVVIGVASVIAVITLVNGANQFVATKISGYGSDTLSVSKTPSVTFSGEEFLKYQKRKNLTYEDFQSLTQACQRCQLTGAQLASLTGKVVYGTQSSTNTSIRGWTANMAE